MPMNFFRIACSETLVKICISEKAFLKPCVNRTIECPLVVYSVPWFPRKKADLDKCCSRYTELETDYQVRGVLYTYIMGNSLD